MPLYKNISNKNFSLGLWRIEEASSFFESKMSGPPDNSIESRKLQWFASRYLLNEMMGEKAEITKDESGKPAVKGSNIQLSISHTPAFAGVILSPHYRVGIDLEMLNAKVQRVAHKFLRPDEIESIPAAQTIAKLILYWSAKEALYKFYGKSGIEFKTQLLIEPFELQTEGELAAAILEAGGNRIYASVEYGFFDNHVLSYIVGR